jgi:hypothetical protein
MGLRRGSKRRDRLPPPRRRGGRFSEFVVDVVPEKEAIPTRFLGFLCQLGDQVRITERTKGGRSMANCISPVPFRFFTNDVHCKYDN